MLIALRQRSNKYWSVYLRVLFPSLTDVNGFSFCSSVKGLLQGYWWVIGLDNSRHNVCFAVMDKWFLKSNGSVSSTLCPCYLVLSVSNMPSTAAVVHEFMRSSCSIFKSLWSWTLQKLPHHFFTFLFHFFFFCCHILSKDSRICRVTCKKSALTNRQHWSLFSSPESDSWLD